MTATPIGKVFLVGAGPGDPELLTLKGARCLERADVILYDDLIDDEVLELANDDAELVYVGKRAGKHCADQRAIEASLIDQARRGKLVVRLKGGDPFIFGRGGEEAEALLAAGIPFEVVPGVSSAIAAPAYAGIPLTHRAYASSVAIVTGHKAKGEEEGVRWRELARSVDTLVILMGLGNLRHIMAHLAKDADQLERSVAVIQQGTQISQRSVIGTVSTIAGIVESQTIVTPAIIVVGTVVGLAERLAWFAPAAKLRPALLADQPHLLA